MKPLITFLLSTFWIFSYSQEKVFTAEYRNMLTTRYCTYTKNDMKPFNGYVKFDAPTKGNIIYQKIENGCNGTLDEEFNAKNELLYRRRYLFDNKNDQIISYKYDSVNLGKSELFDKKITDTTMLVGKKILNFYHADYKDDNNPIITPFTGIIFSDEYDEISSIQYKNGIAVKLMTYYKNKEFDSSSTNIPKLTKKESYNILFNAQGNICNDSFKDQKYPFIFTGEYIKWDENGHILVRKNLD